MPSNPSIAPAPAPPPPAPAVPPGAFPSQKQKRKRLPRAAIACIMCRRRKSKCNQGTPACSHCLQYGIECTYPVKKQDRSTLVSQQSTLPPVAQASTATSRVSTAPIVSLSAPVADHVPVNPHPNPNPNPVVFHDSTLPHIEPHQSPGSATSVSHERPPAENEFGMGTSRMPGLLAEYGLPRDQDPEREARSINNDVDLQSINPIPLDYRASSHLPVGHSDQGPRNEIASGDSIDEINDHTNGAEFFGPSGTLPFLARLLARSRVSIRHDALSTTDGRPTSNDDGSNPGQLSLVNFLHSEDYPVPTRQHTPEQYHTPEQSFPSGRMQSLDPPSRAGLPLSPGPLPSDQNRTQSRSHVSVPSPNWQRESPNNRPTTSGLDISVTPADAFDTRSSQLEVEKKCINLFFANLHYIHPILRKSSFIARCAREVWFETRKQEPRNSRPAHRSRFLALYNAVCAVGAITADEEMIFGCVTTGATRSHSRTTPTASKMSTKGIYPPLKLARVFFEQAKLNLGDVFEICSLESTQALFLMSVFSQNALKPHSCYMYSGMAARTALAIGISNVKARDSSIDQAAASNLWWCIYAHEMEMCCASGRDTLFKPPGYYSVSLVPVDEADLDTHIVGAMVSFSKILQVASEELYHPSPEKSLLQMSGTANELDDALQQWKRDLPPILNLDTSSLRDPEWLTKQKIVLNLRFWNARIILHRQFLIASGKTHDLETFSRHIYLCLDASRETIKLLYETYLNRHYFRTWWYNTTYVLYASMIILYLILLNFNEGDTKDLVKDVEKSLEILGSMDEVHVANRCARLISEVLDIAKKQISSRKAQADASLILAFSDPGVNAATAHEQRGDPVPMASEAALDGEVLSNLVDFNLLGDFAGFDDLNYFFGGGHEMSAGSADVRSGGYENDDTPLVDSHDYFRGGHYTQGGEDGVLL